MIQESSITTLFSQWQSLISSPDCPEEYRSAVLNCIHDLQQLITSGEDSLGQYLSSLPSKEVEEYLLQQEADDYLSTIEAHEPAA